MTILYVDDDREDCEVFADALHDIGRDDKLVCVHNGLEAIDYLKSGRQNPDLIFLDINMPLMNGIDFLQAVRKTLEHFSVPIIIYTTSENPLDKSKTESLGVKDYLVKPAAYKDVISLINSVLTKG